MERTTHETAQPQDRPGAGAAWPGVSVVILSYNRKDALAVTLEKITTTLAYPADQLDVIVVDNASTDGTPAMVARDFPAVTLLVNEKNVGVAGWNRGFQQSRRDYVLILDDDCYMTGDMLRRVVEGAEAHQADLVSFTVLTSFEEGVSFNERYNTGLLSYWGCSALVRRRVLDALGGYDAHIFLWANELELTMRLLDQGGRHLFLPDVTSVHMKAPKPPGVYHYQAHRLNTRNFAYIAGKLLRGRDAVVVFFNLLTGLLVTALRRPKALCILPALLEGGWTGLRRRRPVRAEVSALYARHFHAFVNPVPFQLGLWRWASFFRERAGLYPEEAASLSL